MTNISSNNFALLFQVMHAIPYFGCSVVSSDISLLCISRLACYNWCMSNVDSWYPSYGFASTPDLIHSRCIASGSMPSTCQDYIKHSFNKMMNMSLWKGNARQIMSQGFQLNSSLPTGLIARNNNNSRLTESVDSYRWCEVSLPPKNLSSGISF